MLCSVSFVLRTTAEYIRWSRHPIRRHLLAFVAHILFNLIRQVRTAGMGGMEGMDFSQMMGGMGGMGMDGAARGTDSHSL